MLEAISRGSLSLPKYLKGGCVEKTKIRRSKVIVAMLASTWQIWWIAACQSMDSPLPLGPWHNNEVRRCIGSSSNDLQMLSMKGKMGMTKRVSFRGDIEASNAP